MAKPRLKFSDDELLELLTDKLIGEQMSMEKALEAVGQPRRNFYYRVVHDTEFAAKVDQLRKCAMEVMEDQLIPIADDGTLGRDVRNSMLDTRKWILARRVERFREKKDITTDGKPMLIADL